MALAYLLDPCLQHQNRAGVNNVNGYFEVFEYDTDDRATVYTDFAGTLAPTHIGIDNNGRAVMIVDSAIAYRVEMHAPNGELIYNQAPIWTVASGGGVGALVKVVSTDGTVDVQKTTVGAVTTYDLSVEGENEPSSWGFKTCSASAINVTGEWVEVPYVSSEGSISYNNGWTATKNCAVDIAASLEMDSGDSDALNNFDVKCEFFKNGSSVLVENGQLDPSKSLDRVCFEYKGAANASDVIDAKIYVRSAEALTVDLVGRAFYNEECDGLIGGGGGGTTYTAGEGIDITGDVISIDDSVVQHKLVAGDNISINQTTNVISVTGLSQYVTDTELTTILQGYQEALTAGNGISISSGTISAKVDGDTITVNGNGELVATGSSFTQEQSDWAQTNTSSVDYIKNKPATKPVVAGDNITITETSESFTISATSTPQVQSDWTQNNDQAVDFIKHKPTIPDITIGTVTIG